MKHYFKTIFKSSLVALFCLGALTASALPIKVVNVLPFADTVDSGTILTSETGESIFIDVEFDKVILDFRSSTTLRPTLSFKIGNVLKIAQFTDIYDNFMTFRYFPTANDYGNGFKITDVGNASARILINIPDGLIIFDTTSTDTLSTGNQYNQAVATAVNADSYNQSIGINLFKIENSDGAGISINRGSSQTITVSRPTLAADNTTDIKLIGVSTNTLVATVTPSPQTLNGGSSSINFIITGVAPGTSLVRIYSQDHPTEFVEIPVTVTLSGTERAVTFDPPELRVPENAASSLQYVKVTVGIAPTAPVILNVTKTGLNANQLICPATVTIAANSRTVFFPINTPDGDVNAILTFSDPSGNYDPANLQVLVENVAPSIVLPVPTVGGSGQLTATMTAVAGETVTLTAEANDPAGTNDVISYSWTYDNNGVPTTVNGRTASLVFDKDGTIILNAWDEDGGRAIPLYITVTIETGVLLKLTVAQKPTLAGAGTGFFRYLDPSNRVWSAANTTQRFGEKYEKAGVSVTAIPDPGSYLFTWLAEDGILKPKEAYDMPTMESEVVIKLAEVTAVQHLFSREYPPNAGIDGFGDIDADGLSDWWEAKWFGVATSDSLGSTASTDDKDANGAEGNADGDYLPLAGLEAIPNIIEGGQVLVYQYPILDHGGALWNWTGYLPNIRNPFSSIIEYRGLVEDRGLGDGWVRYAMRIPAVGSPLRGNDPATDPNIVDTDADGMNDGWEYYFWTTIMYEVNTQNWRAFDPSFNFYNAEDSSESGLPLLKTYPPDQNITNALPNAYAMDGLGSEFRGTITNMLPIRPGTFTVTFDDGTTNGIVYTDNGKGSLYADIPVNVLVDPVTLAPVPTEVQILSINYTTGAWRIVPPAGPTNHAAYVISYEVLDGLYDRQQLLNAFDPAIRGGDTMDTDQDGLYDWEEFILGTNPLHWDTDGDSMPDGWEVERGLDPLNGDRVLKNANGALGNPDGDKMAGKHPIKHSSVYVNDLANETYWNGEKAFGFNPNYAWKEGREPAEGEQGVEDKEEKYDLTNLEEFRVAEYYIFDLGFVNTVDKDNWLEYTTDPCDNDTNGDGIPDGWALYVGVSAILPVPPRWVDRLLAFPIGQGDDFDDDKLSVLAEFQCTGAAELREADETVTIDGVTALRRAFGNLRPDWTNKKRPTDPWNADTDGDGLPDNLEYIEKPVSDYNFDGSPLVNLDPTSVDTDGDWLPDGWEYFMGLQTTNNPAGDFESPSGTYGDPDGDGLSNYQEYLVAVNYGWRYDKRYGQQDPTYWMPRPVGDAFFPTDPYDISFRRYDAGDFLRPFPSPSSLQSGLKAVEGAEASLSIAVDPPADPVYGYTYLELLQRTMDVMQDGGFFGLPAAIIERVSAFEPTIRNANFSYGLQPLSWDSSYWAISPKIQQYFFIKEQAIGLYASSNPRSVDSDGDGMEDYWEIFHGMNPIYGGDFSQTDRMAGDPDYNRAISMNSFGGLAPFARAGEDAYRVDQLFAKWRPYGLPEPSGPAYNNLFWNITIPYDLVNNPELSGCPFGDIDKDGLSNLEESFNLYSADVFSHTDPSPYWLTDISYYSSYFYGNNGAGSHVNNYYASGSMPWWWNYAYDRTFSPSPAYLFDFEVNEGYDTDNDNISDREELASTDSLGSTDPLDFDSPRSRKAMYLNGNAVCRTRNPYFHDKWALTSYSVEMWFRSETPVGSGYQTLIERPVVIPVDSPGVPASIRRTFRLSLTPDGRFRAELDNDALATFSAETTAENGKISPNVWYHVAVTMDSQKNRFIIYLNGAMMASLACDIKPATGYFVGTQYVDYDLPGGTNDVTQLNVFRFSPAPIVVGASDSRPSSVIAGPAPHEFTNFFTGWVDEIRVWDRVRTQGEIQNDMYKRYDKKDIARINDARFVWEQNNSVMATSLSDFPQKILYHYSFDNMPDVIPSADRDPTADIPGSETDALPAGYTSSTVQLARPPVTDYQGAPWWISSPVKSTAYSADDTYVPVIENTAAHLRQYPPFDIKTVLPVYDAGFNLLGYRWRQSMDWIATYGMRMSAYNPVDPEALFDVDLRLVPNSANPYGYKYMTGLAVPYELNPDSFLGIVGLLSRYEDLPIYTDMLPLLDAVGDIDVDMWDGEGPGWNSSALDTDGDGLPDWWETANGLDPYDGEGDNGAYGDPDGDGLDNWGEYLAGTNPFASDTNGDGYSDYDSRDDGQSLTYGEMYDDQDGMPSAWEIKYGLNPNRYDAADDLDGDGWSNYDEYMGGTLPNSAFSYPVPDTQFTVNYDGPVTNIPSIIVYTYSENTSGTNMGGGFDGRLSTHNSIAGDGGYLGSRVITEGDGYTYYVSNLYYGKITPGSAVLSVLMTVNGTNVVENIPIGLFNEEMGNYTSADQMGGIRLYYESGMLVVSGKYVGAQYSASYEHGWVFPATVRHPIVAAGTHIRGGYNRFFGFLDTDGSGDYTVGEPAGLSVAKPLWVSYDALDANLALTDFLVGYPRLGWAKTDPEIPYNGSDFYTVTISTSSGVAAKIDVKKPRTFFHEGDLLRAGIKGLDFKAATKATFTYTVADNGVSISTGSFVYDLGVNASRRPMKARYPIQSAIVYGTVANLEWEMDYRTQGARIKIRNVDENKVYYDDVVPLPVRHGKIADEVYFYNCAPQLVDGKKFFALPPGLYEYTITEVVNSTGITKQSIVDRFQLVDKEVDPLHPVRDLSSISGNVSYFGKAEIVESSIDLHIFNGTETSFAGVVGGTQPLTPGTVSIRVIGAITNKPIESLNDSNANGALLSESGSALSGSIDYTNRVYQVFFDPGNPMPAGSILRIVFKSMSKPIVIEAYALSPDATSCFAYSGQPVARTVMYRKGPYTIEGLKSGTENMPGKFAVLAYIDSNNNRMCDYWESSGLAVNGAQQGPIAYVSYPPIEVPSSKSGMDIVLRDKDTDNDLLPDAWEYQNFTNLKAKSGYDQNSPDLPIWQEYADGPLDSDPNRVDTDEDGLSDAVELRLTRTNTHLPDTDFDGVSDLEEFLSGSDPLDPNSTKAYKTLGIEFDAEGKPFVVCPHPALVRGIVITYILNYKADLASLAWEPVDEAEVRAPDVTEGRLPASTITMKPNAEDVDWQNGFFKVDVQVDYGAWTF